MKYLFITSRGKAVLGHAMLFQWIVDTSAPYPVVIKNITKPWGYIAHNGLNHTWP